MKGNFGKYAYIDLSKKGVIILSQKSGIKNI